MQQIALFGYSGHAFVVADAILQSGDQLIGYYNRSKASLNPFHLAYLGNEQELTDLEQIMGTDVQVFVSIGDNSIRQGVCQLLSLNNSTFARVVHPAATLSALATVGVGSFVAAGARINALASIGQHVIINTGAIVEHECQIGDYAHVAPGAVLAGNVHVGEGSFIGAGAVVKQGVQIGQAAVVGAGAVVLKDVPEGEVWVGNPAKRLKK